MPYGIRLAYANDRVDLNNDGVNNWPTNLFNVYTCPDGMLGTPADCGHRYAANWPDRVVVYITAGPGGASSGELDFIGVDSTMRSASSLVCAVKNPIPGTQFLAHEFSHYMGLAHTFLGDGDGLSDTLNDPMNSTTQVASGACASTLTPTAILGGQIVRTDNAVSYFYNISPKLTPMQAQLVRAAAWYRLNK
jgi:hypothetical protein